MVTIDVLMEANRMRWTDEISEIIPGRGSAKAQLKVLCTVSVQKGEGEKSSIPNKNGKKTVASNNINTRDHLLTLLHRCMRADTAGFRVSVGTRKQRSVISVRQE